MANAYEGLIEFLDEGEEVEAIVFGEWGWSGRGEPDPPPIPEEIRNIALSLEEAKPYMRGWEIYGGFGAPECYAMYAWTDSRIIWITQYDGATGLDCAPRNPADVAPYILGG
jgi:hypothetical protein